MNSLRIIISVLVVIGLTGCAAKPLPKIAAHYYPQCIRPLGQMQEADSKVAQQAGTTALGGALAGAIIGVAITGRFEGALIGLGAGAVMGATIGYSFAKLDQTSDENTRFASIRITANQDLSKANRLQLYSYECLMCYLREFDGLHAAYENGRMTKEEYAKRFTEIRNAMVELGKIIGDLSADIARTESEFNTSLARPIALASAPKPARNLPEKRVKRQPQTKSKQRLSDSLAEKRARIERAQEKNDEDLTVMLDDFSGKPRPPKQDVQAIERNYGSGYSEAQQNIEELRTMHKEVMTIMDQAAVEVGIDMV